MRINFTPYDSMKPGTGGLRRPTREFIQPGYIQGFVQAIINRLKNTGMPIKKMALGSDGRYPSREILPELIRVLLANGVEKILVANRDFVTTTPAMSHMIRHHKCDGGFMLSASHNPGGIDGDFGIKFETAAGGQPAESFTNPLYQDTRTLDYYETLEISDDDALSRVEYIDAVSEYVDLMREIFDFDVIKKWFDDGNTFRYDCMNAAAGPFAKRIFCSEFGVPENHIWRADPLPDFGGAHPEPNPVHAHELYEFMINGGADFGAASDGDGDRDMVLGRGVFISPPDALAIMARHYKLIPYFRDRLTGVMRSVPTSSALDYVVKSLGLDLYATPTGWKFFVSLMDAGRAQLCGEESFGQGADYIREKDAIFAVLYWLNIMGATGKSAAQLQRDLWDEFGRVFYTQFSFEGVDADRARELVARIRAEYPKSEFNYTDPATGELSPNQGFQFFTDDGGRFFFRLSGTGTRGATLRFYAEKHETDPAKFDIPSREYLKPLLDKMENIFRVNETFNNPEMIVAI